jgi:hypothetical protein
MADVSRERLLRSAGRDLALLRRCGNPEISQTETLSNTALLRRLFVEGAVKTYWNALKPEPRSKFNIEFTSIRTKSLDRVDDYLMVLTGDHWSDLLIGGVVNKAELSVEYHDIHSGMTLGPIDTHLKSIVIAHSKFAFTPKDCIEYHAYQLGEVHLDRKRKQLVAPYEELVSSRTTQHPIKFGNNGPSSLAIKGFVNRVVRSEGFHHMYDLLKERGYVPDDVQFPSIRPDGLSERLGSEYGAKVMSLRFTSRAMRTKLPEAVRTGRSIESAHRFPATHL